MASTKKTTKIETGANIIRARKPIEKKPRYLKTHDDDAKFLASKGCTDADVAEFFNVSVRTIHRWKHAHHSFRQALEIGKDVADDIIEENLFRNGQDRYVLEQKVFFRAGDDEPTIVEIKKFVPGNVTAQIFWSKNRRPHNWRDRKEISGPDGGPIEVDHSPRKTLEGRLKVIRERISGPLEDDVVVDIVEDPPEKETIPAEKKPENND